MQFLLFVCSRKALAFAEELDNTSQRLTPAMVDDVSAISGKRLNVNEDKLFQTWASTRIHTHP